MNKLDYNFLNFITLTNRQINFENTIKEIFTYINEDSTQEYRIIIGTDSEGSEEVMYASAIVVHRIGHGGRAFVCKNQIKTAKSLRQKIYNEATLSLLLANKIVPLISEILGQEFVSNNLIIHVDIGQHGQTKDMIKEVVGMVRGSGFKVEIKPDSFAASNVADRFASPPRVVSS